MDDEQAPKKISFGFSKLIKKPLTTAPKPTSEDKIQFIDCLEGKSIKLKDGEEVEEKKPLVIPLKEKDRTSTAAALARIAKEVEPDLQEPASDETVKKDIPQPTVIENETLEARAVRELLEEAKLVKVKKTEGSTLVVPLSGQVKIVGEKESTLEDYDNIPIGDFGMAMLRGMGWQEGKGIGKSCKNVDLVLPKLRPKGMGLGADKVAIATTKNDKSSNGASNEEELKIVKGAYVKIVAGKQSGSYGQISGFDEDSGRVIIKAAIGGANINMNEFMIQAVSKDEYIKQAKVINADKFEEYKRKEIGNSREEQQPRMVKEEKSSNRSRKSADSSDSESNDRPSKLDNIKEESRRYKNENSDYCSEDDVQSSSNRNRNVVQEETSRSRGVQDSSDEDSRYNRHQSRHNKDNKRDNQYKRMETSKEQGRSRNRDPSDSSDDDWQQNRNQARNSRRDDYHGSDRRKEYRDDRKREDFDRKRRSRSYERSKESSSYDNRRQPPRNEDRNKSSSDDGIDNSYSRRKESRKYDKKKHEKRSSDTSSDESSPVARRPSPVAKWRESDKKRKGKKRRRDKSRSRDRRRH